jgi:hypothetical protein
MPPPPPLPDHDGSRVRGDMPSDYLPYDEHATLRYLCGLLLDTVSAVKGAQGALDDSAERLRKAVESQAAATEAVQRSAELLRRLVAVTTWLEARRELMPPLPDRSDGRDPDDARPVLGKPQ